MPNAKYDREIKRLSATVVKVRLERGLTQEQVAADASLATRHYQKLEAGSINPTLRTMLAVAAALRINVRELLE